MERATNPSYEELINKIEFLKQCLLFYADSSNYDGDNPIIMLDSGYQAKYAIESLENIDSFQEKMVEEVKVIMDQYKIDDENGDEMIQKMTEINKMLKNYKNE